MPELITGLVDHAPVGPVHEPATLLRIEVREIDQVRVKAVLAAERVDRRLERPEALAECQLLLVREPLVAEDEHRVLLERLEDRAESRRGERLREIHSLDLRADAGMDWPDRQPARRLGHAPLPSRRRG